MPNGERDTGRYIKASIEKALQSRHKDVFSVKPNYFKLYNFDDNLPGGLLVPQELNQSVSHPKIVNRQCREKRPEAHLPP